MIAVGDMEASWRASAGFLAKLPVNLKRSGWRKVIPAHPPH